MHSELGILPGGGIQAAIPGAQRKKKNRTSAPELKHARPFRYGAAMLLVALVFFVRLELQPVLESRAPFLMFTFSVMVSAWYGGFGPGLLATVLGTAVGFYFFLNPTAGWMAADKVDSLLILLSVLTGVAISFLSGSMYSARAKAELAAHALLESEHQLKLSLQSANAATLEWNLVTGKMSWSDEHYRLFGTEPGGFEPTAGNWIDRVHPDDRERVRVTLTSAAENRSDVNVEYRIVRPDGDVRWMNTRGQVFFDEHGRAERMLGVVIDMTERKKMEKEREELRLREQAARAREQITKAETARKNQEFKSAVLDAVAHDMKTPLTSIKAAVTCLLGQTPGRPTETAELLSVINEETDHMTCLVTEAIEAARVEVGRLQLAKGPYFVKETISAALDEMKHKARGRPVQVQLEKALAPADIDFQLVKHVIKQLLDNAIKYSPEGTPLKIACRPSGDRIVVDVADSGPGIPEEEQSRIFDEFYRVPAERGRASGTGMGLFIAKRIVDAHGGKIWVTSKPGLGSVFHVALPVYRRSLE